jgi:hypothetical protein
VSDRTSHGAAASAVETSELSSPKVPDRKTPVYDTSQNLRGMVISVPTGEPDTKTYDLDELNRLRAEARRASLPERGDEASPEAEDDDVPTGQMESVSDRQVAYTPENPKDKGGAREERAVLARSAVAPKAETPGAAAEEEQHPIQDWHTAPGDKMAFHRPPDERPPDDDDSLDEEWPTQMRPPESLAPGSALFVPPQRAEADRALTPAAPWRGLEALSPSDVPVARLSAESHAPLPGTREAMPEPPPWSASLYAAASPSDKPLGLEASSVRSSPMGPSLLFDPGTDPAVIQTGSPFSTTGRQRLLAVLAGVALGLAVLFVYGSFLDSEPNKSAAVPKPSNSAAAAPLPSAAAAPGAPLDRAAASAPFAGDGAASAPPAGDEAASAPVVVDAATTMARNALTKLRDGIGACLQRGTNALPPTSPAVPSSLQMIRPNGYAAKGDDWKATVFSCAKFSAAAPMHYQLQWQSAKPFKEGMGVAWMDRNGDGVADQALRFRATVNKGKLDLGEISPLEAAPPVLPIP